jgi:hypothetical protein
MILVAGLGRPAAACQPIEQGGVSVETEGKLFLCRATLGKGKRRRL